MYIRPLHRPSGPFFFFAGPQYPAIVPDGSKLAEMLDPVQLISAIMVRTNASCTAVPPPAARQLRP